MAAIKGMEFPNHLALKANRAAFTHFTGGQQAKQKLFPRCRSTPLFLPHSHDYLPGLSVEKAGKTTRFPISPWKELNYIVFHLFHEGIVSG